MLRRIASLGGTGGSGEALAGDAKGADLGRAGRPSDVLAPAAGARRLRPAQEPAADDAGHRRRQDRRRAGPAPRTRLATMARPAAPRALNLMTPKSLLKPLPAMPPGTERRVYEGDTAQPIKPQLLTIALVLLFTDILAVLLLQAGGLLFGRRVRRAGAAALAALAIAMAAPSCCRQPGRRPDARPRPATGALRPASPHRRRARHPGHRQGHLRLRALWRRGHRRGQPPGPRRPRQVPDRAHGRGARRAVRRQHPRPTRSPSSRCSTGRCWPTRGRCPRRRSTKIDAYMKQGGMIIFDTKDYGQGMPGRLLLARRRRHAAAAPARQPRHPAPGAGARAPRADQVVLPAALLPRPLGRRAAVGGSRGAARQRPGPAGAARRRGQLDPGHVERLRRRLGAR